MFESPERPVWWLPSLGFFIFLALMLAMFAGPDRLFEDPGVGRHLRTAEVIVETGQIPRTDPLSFTYAGKPWFDFEWAFEATLGELYRAGGLPLIVAFCYALFATTVLGVYRTLLQSGLSLGVVVLYTGMAFLTLYLHFAARPVLFTYLFLALVVETWFRHPVPRVREWLILPVIFVFWANIHAGWMAGLVFLAGSLAGRLMDRCLGRVDGDDAPLIPWAGLTLLCALATLLNPWGWHLHQHIVTIATTYKSFALWDEYLPPDFNSLRMSAITVLFILAVLFFARASRRTRPWMWETVLPVLFFLYQGLKAQRHVLLLVEVAAVPIARDLGVLLASPWPKGLRRRFPFIWELVTSILERLRQFQERQRLAAGDAWLCLLVAVLLGWRFLHAPIGQHIAVGKSATPGLVTFLQEHPDRFQRPLTTTWNAGPLLWNMRPGFRVSFDDRGDFYGDKTVFAFVNLGNGIDTADFHWREELARGNYDSLIIDPYLQLNQLIHFLPEWKEVYRDDHSVVYWRDREN